jgi:hypothetical protein
MSQALLTLSTLNARSTPLVLVLIIHALGVRGTLLLPLRRLLQVDLLLEDLAGDLVQLPSRRQRLFEPAHLFRSERFRELDRELDVEVTVVVMTMGGHTLLRDDLDVTYGLKT